MDLKLEKKTKFKDCDNLLVLDNGIVLGMNNQQGEVYHIDFDSDKIDELPLTQGCEIQNWARLDWDKVAMGRHQSVLIMQFQNKVG